MWLIALILFWGVLLLAVTTLQRSRGEALVASGSCPRCRVPLQHLSPSRTEQPPRSWEVLACPTCTTAVPIVQGIPGNAGWCPHCKQRALELSAQRREPTPQSPIRVSVHEHCHLCGHQAEIEVAVQSMGGRGKVIPFPGSHE